MPSAVSHAIFATALGMGLPATGRSRGVLLIGAACSVLPDLDVIGFRLGIRYGDLLGHRGLTHSLPFAAAVALVVAALPLWARGALSRTTLGLYVFAATLSHGLLDAFTNGGLGIAFFAPFDRTRYFSPFRPIEVSPIGFAAFFTKEGLSVLPSEILWVWLPAAALACTLAILRWSAGPVASHPRIERS